jgi:hypothetical protein
MSFRIEAIDPAELAKIRADGRDVDGRPSVPLTVEDDRPQLRCCLRLGRPGEEVLLISHRPPGGLGAYAESGPVFVHAHDCGGYPAHGGWPVEYRDRRQVLRAYDHEGRIHGAELVDAAQAEPAIEALLADPGVALIQSRNVLYGCYMFAIRRA